jgi:hypothetical protein
MNHHEGHTKIMGRNRSEFDILLFANQKQLASISSLKDASRYWISMLVTIRDIDLRFATASFATPRCLFSSQAEPQGSSSLVYRDMASRALLGSVKNCSNIGGIHIAAAQVGALLVVCSL